MPAGANHPIILERMMPRVESLTITTFTEKETNSALGQAYVTADLRELPFADESFDTIVCVSTLDHVGMDNSAYGSTEPRSQDPDGEVARRRRSSIASCGREAASWSRCHTGAPRISAGLGSSTRRG